jgi:uncharacterized protein (UPF0335 family)
LFQHVYEKDKIAEEDNNVLNNKVVTVFETKLLESILVILKLEKLDSSFNPF